MLSATEREQIRQTALRQLHDLRETTPATLARDLAPEAATCRHCRSPFAAPTVAGSELLCRVCGDSWDIVY